MKLDYILVGRIVNAHGIKGEVRVQPRDSPASGLSTWTEGLSPPPPATCTRASF